MTGTEIVGLVPKRTLIEAGRHFLHLQQRSSGLPENEIIRIAAKSMGLDELTPFRPEEKVIEYMIEPAHQRNLTDLTLKEFTYLTASEAPAPGGGSISAAMGALAAALGTMVANLSAHKAGWDERWEEFSNYADAGQLLVDHLLELVDEDTAAFNRIMAALQLPKGSDEEKAARAKALEEATLYATRVPLKTMEAAIDAFPLLEAMAENGNPASVSDAGVGALAARAAVRGARLNVRINAASLSDRTAAQALIERADALALKADEAERHILDIVETKI